VECADWTALVVGFVVCGVGVCRALSALKAARDEGDGMDAATSSGNLAARAAPRYFDRRNADTAVLDTGEFDCALQARSTWREEVNCLGHGPGETK
jgi:hypothetical protein